MKKNYRNFAVVLAVMGITLLQACQKDDQFSQELNQVALSKTEFNTTRVNTFYSSTLPIGNGVVRAWVSENINGEPVSVGVNLSEKALENLPLDPSQYVLTLPKNKGKNFYTHVLIDWNPQGHEPDEIYTVPHFDFHFYIIPDATRLTIGPLAPPNMDVAPANEFVPPFYIQTPGIVPEMGAHWVDVLSPEFHESPFTRTFIWGSYNGEFIFWEPMVTRDYLLSNPNDLTDLRQPEAFQQNGYYATQYKVSYSVSPKEYTVALLNLVYHDGE